MRSSRLCVAAQFRDPLSLAGVAPRVAQAAMRVSNISLTKGTYTDARLLDTSEAIEALPMFRNQPTLSATSKAGTEGTATSIAGTNNSTKETRENDSAATPRTLAPMLAPTAGQNGQNQSIPVNLATGDTDDQNTKKPSKSQGDTGFSLVGGIGLEQ